MANCHICSGTPRQIVKKRSFIKATFATAVLAVPGAVWFATRPTCTGDAADLGIQSIFVDDCQIQQLGKAYRYAHPGEDDLAVLRNLITSAEVSLNPVETIRQEFARGYTVQVDGWVLSRTEARRYALYSLRAN